MRGRASGRSQGVDENTHERQGRVRLRNEEKKRLSTHSLGNRSMPRSGGGGWCVVRRMVWGQTQTDDLGRQWASCEQHCTPRIDLERLLQLPAKAMRIEYLPCALGWLLRPLCVLVEVTQATHRATSLVPLQSRRWSGHADEQEGP